MYAWDRPSVVHNLLWNLNFHSTWWILYDSTKRSFDRVHSLLIIPWKWSLERKEENKGIYRRTSWNRTSYEKPSCTRGQTNFNPIYSPSFQWSASGDVEESTKVRFGGKRKGPVPSRLSPSGHFKRLYEFRLLTRPWKQVRPFSLSMPTLVISVGS